MDEDFNTAEALAVLFNLNKEVNNLLNSDEELSEGVLSEIDSFYRVYGGDVLGIVVPKEKDQLIRGTTASLSIEMPSLKVKAADTEFSQGFAWS